MTAFLDALTGELPERIDTEVCVIGAGAAGITLARELAGRGHKVLLVESGGQKIEAQTQSLYVTSSSGMPYFDLATCRLRYFGGSTNHWGGYCVPNSPIDYEGRPELNLPPWPVSGEMLAPYVARTAEFLEINTDFFDPATQLREKKLDPSNLVENKSDELVTRIIQISPKLRFRSIFYEEIAKSPHILPIEHLNVTKIILDARGNVDHVRAATLNDKHTKIHARTFILCCHAVENARILLDSDEQVKGGIGNRYDHVGRYFMEHPHIFASRMIPSRNFPLVYDRHFLLSHSLNANLSISDKVMREQGLLAYYCRFNPVTWTKEAARAGRRLPNRLMDPASLALYRDVRTIMSDWSGIRSAVSQTLTGSEMPLYYQLEHRIEQSPNPDSRITLRSEHNKLGQREVDMHWAFTDHELNSFNRGQEIVARTLSALHMGRFELEEITMDKLRERGFGHNHHIGTTRMSVDPRDGVVDPNLKVHDVGNLYIAGSSVFPTAGQSGPTMMLLAMALRLAGHVSDELSRG